ncbi:unnamed protein product [Cuscuta europaea]|uniref:Late embryogenesis abundant protein LEA-2 subgroup domain-containing protein n=1 Tax=Cuscuta europaea TaxID=41803 RepID=A0A9P1EBS2_CUSEU|nr:unnamed protein product [Cuscuta europaea]
MASDSGDGSRKCCCFLIIVLMSIIVGVILVACNRHSSPSGGSKPNYHVVDANMTNIAYSGDGLTADFRFTLAASNPNKHKTVDFTNSTEATSLYFITAVVASSTALPVPSPLHPGSSDNLFGFDLHAQDAPLNAHNSGFMRLEVKLMVRLDEKSKYSPLKVICPRLKFSSHGFANTEDQTCVSD